MSKHKIKTILINEINNSKKINEFFKMSSKFNNINELFDKLIFDKEVSVIIVINETSEHLTRVLSKIRIPSDTNSL